jgi:hypothetical protein
MVKSPDFWQQVFNLEEELRNKYEVVPYERVVINFGQWESAMRMNPSIKSCHPHAHLWLTPEFIDKVSSDPIWIPLAGHVVRPEDYLLQNARELEQSRLVSLRYRQLDKKIDLEIKSVNAKLDHLTSLLMEVLEQ